MREKDHIVLKQIAMREGQEKVDLPQAPQHVHEHPNPRFEDLYLFAKITKQFRSLRLKQPVLSKLMHQSLNDMYADAAFLLLPEHPQYYQMDHHEDLERFTIDMVCSLVCAIEEKDAYAKGHSRRVYQYAALIARHIGMSPEEMEALKWASILHDIGKIGIPEKVLNKPGKLTVDEYELVKKHPMKGKTILEPIRQLAPALPAVAYHHERYNGKGYPDGLKGEQIPLAARIIAVADTFDAITSSRSYHRSKSPQEAMLVLDQVAGTQLDARLVNIFRTVHRQLNRRPTKLKKAVNA